MKFRYIVLILFVLISISVIGFSSYQTYEKDDIAYISTNIDSEYNNTFKDLELGIVYDFNIKLPNADKSWVNIWVEGYSNGKQIKPSHLTELSYGHSPNKVEEGNFGLGIINPHTENGLFFLYAPSVKIHPHKIENNPISSEGIYTWDYAVENETIALKAGETKIIGVYVQGIDSFRTYNLQEANEVKSMINENKAVLLLKIKVDIDKE